MSSSASDNQRRLTAGARFVAQLLAGIPDHVWVVLRQANIEIAIPSKVRVRLARFRNLKNLPKSGTAEVAKGVLLQWSIRRLENGYLVPDVTIQVPSQSLRKALAAAAARPPTKKLRKGEPDMDSEWLLEAVSAAGKGPVTLR